MKRARDWTPQLFVIMGLSLTVTCVARAFWAWKTGTGAAAVVFAGIFASGAVVCVWGTIRCWKDLTR